MDMSEIEIYMHNCSGKVPIPLECIEQGKVYLYLPGCGLSMGTVLVVSTCVVEGSLEVTVVPTLTDDGRQKVIVCINFMDNSWCYGPTRAKRINGYWKSISEYKKNEGLYLFE